MNVSLDENGEGVFMEEETTEDVENSSELTEETPEGKDEFVLLYNQDGYKVEATGFDIRKNSFRLKFTNLTHHDIRVSVVDGYINGVMNGIDFSERVSSGKSGIGKATISKNELVSAGIDVIDDVSFSIKVDNAEDSSATLTTIGVMHFSLVEGKIDTSIVYSDAETIRQVQEMLNKLGYDCGAADGIAGKNTNSRILQFENEHGLKETTDISDELLEALKELAG